MFTSQEHTKRVKIEVHFTLKNDLIDLLHLFVDFDLPQELCHIFCIVFLYFSAIYQNNQQTKPLKSTEGAKIVLAVLSFLQTLEDFKIEITCQRM